MKKLTVVFVVLALPFSLKAQETPFVDEAKIEACFERTPANVNYPSCAFDEANECQGRPGGSTTLGMVECMNAEMAVWDKLLNREYGVVRQIYAGRDQSVSGTEWDGAEEALVAAQRAWIAFRDADCKRAYLSHQGGSMRSISHASCMLEKTVGRVFELRGMQPL